MNLKQFEDSLKLDRKGRYFKSKHFLPFEGRNAELCFECVLNHSDTIKESLKDPVSWGKIYEFWQPSGTYLVSKDNPKTCDHCSTEINA